MAEIINFGAKKNTNAYQERPLTIQQGQVIAHAWAFNEEEEYLDFSKHLQFIAETMKSLEDRPKLIGIEGATNSGKTILGNVLSDDGSNVQLINVVQHLKNRAVGARNVDVSGFISDRSKTYVIDEIGYADMDALSTAVQDHVQNGGVAVLLFQCVKDLSATLLNGMTVFELDRNKFELKGCVPSEGAVFNPGWIKK